MTIYLCDAAKPHENLTRIDGEKAPGAVVWTNKDANQGEGKTIHKFTINGVSVALEYNPWERLAIEIGDAPNSAEIRTYLEKVIGANLVINKK